jgi:hypothetical protein
MYVSCNLSCGHVCVSETTSLHLDNYVGPEVENGVTLRFVCVEGLRRLLYLELTNFLCFVARKGHTEQSY